MNTIEANVYRIENLPELSAQYRLYRVKGLSPEQEDYYRNLNNLTIRLSRELRSPVTFTHRDRLPWLVVREDGSAPAAQHQLVRRTVYLEKGADLLTLDFSKLDETTTPIALRFLQFSLQGSIRNSHELWQPNIGSPFFEKRSTGANRSIGMHRGFLVRAMELDGGGLGLCVDVRYKYVSTRPLPTKLDRKDFQRFRMNHAIYHFGHAWYAIQLAEWTELTVTEHLITENGNDQNLLEYLHTHCAKPLPPELVQLSKDCAVVLYYNSAGELRAAPSALCYPVFETSDAQVRREHGRTLMPPPLRRGKIHEFAQRHLQRLTFGKAGLRLSKRPLTVPDHVFRVPDFRFGANRVLSVEGTPGAVPTSFRDFGRRRLAMLTDRNTGLFVQTPFLQQYLFMPETIRQSWGPQFLRDLCRAVDALYPQANPYSPRVVPYEDRKGRTFVEQAHALIAAANEHNATTGYAVVMIHEPADRRHRQTDQLAAFAIQRLYEECDIRAAVMHTAVGSECYALESATGASPRYVVAQGRRGKWEGYLRGVALNKVLLTNEKWPWVLAEPTHADLTIGVDLKAQHVAFTAIGRGGAYVKTHLAQSRFKEQLQADEFRKLLTTAVRDFTNTTGDFVRVLVIHRDGRLFECELRGAHAAMDALADEGLLAPGATLTCLEIGKSSFTSLRLFELVEEARQNAPRVENPCVGRYYIPNPSEGYLCATGFPFERDGTVYPLHVRKVDGPLSMEQCLEDVYGFTTLAWSRPEDCARQPLTIKLNDRRLFEDAGEYDELDVELHQEEAAK
ncbi:MAG TPA: hypothetical protein VIS71_08635 [Terrimicrobium sp.]